MEPSVVVSVCADCAAAGSRPPRLRANPVRVSNAARQPGRHQPLRAASYSFITLGTFACNC
jgi:hypothetical protein